MRAIVVLFLIGGLQNSAFAKTCQLSIEGNDQMKFNKSELTVEKGCTKVKLTLKHTGKLPKTAMGHNWVLTLASDMQTVVQQGISAGLSNEYLPKDKSKVIASTKIIGGGDSTSVTFDVKKLKPGSSYKYFCSFPGHFSMMQGTLHNKAGAEKSKSAPKPKTGKKAS